MRMTIDNLDGLGALDYTPAVAAEGPISVQRALNVPSRCTAEIVLGFSGLAVPSRRARVTVTNAAGALLFTGYLATEPVRIYAGEATTGAAYRARLSAVSDEWLLDNLGSGAGAQDATLLGLTGSALVAQLTTRAQAGGATVLTIASSPAGQTTGAFVPSRTAPWSSNSAACMIGSAWNRPRMLPSWSALAIPTRAMA